MTRTVLALGLATVACAPPSAPSGPAAIAEGHGLRPLSTPPLPLRLPGFELVDSVVYPNKNLGRSHRYVDGHGFRPDVYLYPLPSQGHLCLAKCLEEAAAAEILGFQQSIPLMIERGYADSMIRLREENAPSVAGSWLSPGRHLVMRLVREGAPLESHLLVFAGRETYLKVRATFPAGQVAPESFQNFIRTLLTAVPPPYSCRAGGSVESGVSTSVLLPNAAEIVAKAVDSVIAVPPSQVDYRDPDAGRWRTVPTFANPQGVVVFATVAPVGDSTKAVFTAQSLCRAPGGEKDGSTAAQMLKMIQLNAALTAALKDKP